MLCCNTVIMQHNDASPLSGSWLWFWQITSSTTLSSNSLLHEWHIILILFKKAYLSLKLVMDLHLYNLYNKVYKSFLPFQKLFSFCCSTECQWITICRPCYKVCVFCATFGFVLLSRQKLSIKTLSDKFIFFVSRLGPLILLIHSECSHSNHKSKQKTEDKETLKYLIFTSYAL